MSKAPYMPLFCDAYIADTRHLSLEETGAYLMLLMVTWRNNGCALPDDNTRMARILGITINRWVSKIRPALVHFFDISDGTWRQIRLEKEWKRSQKYTSAQSENGKLGGRPKTLISNETDKAAALSRLRPDESPRARSPNQVKEEEVKEGTRTDSEIPRESPESYRENPGGDSDSLPRAARALAKYAFEGRKLRLNQNDFERLRNLYATIPDFMAELGVIDAWLVQKNESCDEIGKKPPDPFSTATRWLNRKHQENMEKKMQAHERRYAWGSPNLS